VLLCFQWNANQVWRGVPMCQAIRDNPNGIESISPGLRGTSYPGGMTEKSQTLKGLHLFHKSLICNPFRVVIFLVATQRRPSLNRANAGLRDAIPLGLKNRPLHQVGSPYTFSIRPKTAKNQKKQHKFFSLCSLRSFAAMILLELHDSSL